jgi:arylsulfatase A-like enzyme
MGVAMQLQHAGFHTAMISPFGQRHGAHHYYAGFREMHNTGMNGAESAEHVMPVVNKWLDDHAESDRWYLHINFWDPHTPFRVPADYGDPFEDEPPPAWLDDDEVIARHLNKTGPHSAQDLGMFGPGDPDRWPRELEAITDRPAMKKWIDGYDTAVKYVDDQIKLIVDKLKAAGVYDDTAIIISADHGENLGELGIYSEHGTADQATCHIPMIVKWPGGRQGVVDDALRYNIDWAPTLMDLVGREHCDIWDGQSYAGAIVDGAGPAAGRDELVISQCCHVCQRSVRFGRWLWIRTFHDGFHVFPDEMLFDIEADPHEQNDVADENPQVCGEAARRYLAWHSTQMWKMADTCTDVVDPMWTVIREGGPMHARHRTASGGPSGPDGPGGPGGPGGPDGSSGPLPEYLLRLERTGREDGARALGEKYAKYLVR